MKGLVLAHFPSPYRVDVFKELCKEYDLNIFFEICKDQSRSSEWFVKETDFNINILSKNSNCKRVFFKELINIKKYDFILAYDYHTVKSMIMQLVAIINNVPYFVNCDGAFIRKGKAKAIIKKFFFKRAALFFASGENAKRYFEYFGADSNKIFIHNFTSLKKEDIIVKQIEEEEKVMLKEEVCLDNKKTVISIGQFIERKGYDVLLNAWKDLDNKYQLVIIGGGEEEEKYKDIIKENKYINVKLLGFKNKEEIKRYYKAADIFVLPTREDIWGLVINEAMAYGLPVVTTDKCIAGLEMINNKEQGEIVPVDNVEELYNSLKKFLSNNRLCNVVGVKNLEMIKGYTIENISKAHIEAIKYFFDRIK